eukprot:10133798-Prorocentrum_lima.AAC.1
MTSSLVGSEMCIRDSLHRMMLCLSTVPSRCTASSACASPNRMPSASCWTVSYTHLTLPTICSV